MRPTIAIIGRPNVGKSTLFNRIVGQRKALTHDYPGVTRDRNFAVAEWGGREFLCVDTGGFPLDEESIDDKVSVQIDLAIEESDIILCVFDGESGLIPEEKAIVERLRKINKPVFYAVNKIDVPAHEMRQNDFFKLGVEKLYPVSGEHGYQLAELLDAVVEELPRDEKAAVDDKELRIAIVGRPNVGKSSLVNALLGQSRVVVDSTPGTTRDSIDTPLHYEGRPLRLIDTAGIRRRSQKGGKLEKIAVLQATRALERADVCLLVLSAEDGLLKQDAHIAGYIEEQGQGCIMLWNKMDLKSPDSREKLLKTIRDELRFLPQFPVLFSSALTGKGVEEVIPALMELYDELGAEISTSKLNDALADLVEHHSIPMYKGREVKLYYATQVGTHPPIIIVFTNWPSGVPESYRRYLVHGFQRRFGLERIPVRVVFRKRK